jgi:hypothetical protein
VQFGHSVWYARTQQPAPAVAVLTRASPAAATASPTHAFPARESKRRRVDVVMSASLTFSNRS